MNPIVTGSLVAWGSYTPALSSTTNLGTIDLISATWFRVGAWVQVQASFDIEPSSGSGTATQFDMSVPIESEFTDAGDAIGLCASGESEAGYVDADVGGNELTVHFEALATASHVLSVNATYRLKAP